MDIEDKPLQAWEYLIVSGATIRKGTLQDRLNALGWEGWEVVGFAQSDKTIGLNSLEVVLKRPRASGGTPLPANVDYFDEGEDGECLECGGPIGATDAKCRACGWTWT